MLGKNFRPWGEVSWLISKTHHINWNIIGCVSFEDRCYGLRINKTKLQIDSNLYFNILPPETTIKRFQDKKQSENKRLLIQSGVPEKDIIDLELLTSVENFLAPTRSFLKNSNGNIILDISCFPKRYFFPLLKTILSYKEINHLIVAYTKPEKYSTNELSGDPSEWSHIPGGFMSREFPEPKPELAIISVGFMPLGLPKLLIGRYRDAHVKLIFPYPPGPPNYQRNWEFVRRIFDSYPLLSLNEMLRVHAIDTSDAFDKLVNVTNNGQYKCILAPYGPKPISLAMALFSIVHGVPVYYTQPNYYAPDYSTGIKETISYWVVASGQSLYS